MLKSQYSSKFIITKFIVLCLILVFVSVGKIYAAGGLDPTFGTGGKVITSFGPFGDVVEDILIQPDGKFIVTGYASDASNNADFMVARYNADGSLDTSFDTDGKVIAPTGNGYDAGYSLAIQPDGKIISAGFARFGTRYDFVLMRFNADGSLDTSFDGDGKVITSIFADDDELFSMALQPDGKIIVGGETQSTISGRVFALVRYNANGSLDTSFDGDGIVTTSIRGTGLDSISKVLLQPDGKIIAAGRSYAGINQDYDFAMARYNTDGSLDTSFDGDGKVTTPVSTTTSPDGISSIALQTDGKIVAVGNAYASPNNDDSIVARYNANGSLDTSFDGDGKLYFSFGNLTEFLSDVKIQLDGKIVAVGHRNNGSSPTGTTGDFALVRLNSNGSFDTTFDGDGKITTAIGNGISGAFALSLQPNGKILAAGYTSPVDSGDLNLAIVRYMNDLNIADFDGDTKTDLSIFRPSNGQWWFQKSSSNSVSAFAFGTATDKITAGDYTGDGKTDIAVWRPATGEWYVLRSEDNSFFAHPFGVNGDIPAPADFDGDGRTDEAVFRPSTATWYILRSSGGTTIQQFGANGDKPVAADYDGDGKADIAIFRPNGANGAEWWIQRSSNASVFALQFGEAIDKPVQGDYTGDGKTDIAFFHPVAGSNNWFVLRSEDFSYFAFSFGTNGDTPVPGDYDGDGKFDAGVFRSFNSTWYVQRSTAGTLIQQFGASGDVPVPNASNN